MGERKTTAGTSTKGTQSSLLKPHFNKLLSRYFQKFSKAGKPGIRGFNARAGSVDYLRRSAGVNRVGFRLIRQAQLSATQNSQASMFSHASMRDGIDVRV